MNFKVNSDLAEGEITVGYIKKESHHIGEMILAMFFKDKSWFYSLLYRNKKWIASKIMDNTTLEVIANTDNHAILSIVQFN